jgi:hypothetical protein
MNAEDPAIDCRSPAGVTVGLIDGIIAAARVVRSRDLTHPAVIEALRDIADDEDVRSLLDAPTEDTDE